MDWTQSFQQACDELKLAAEELRLANIALARAKARSDVAATKYNALFREWVKQISG